MLINALIIGITRLHIRWKNKRYERARLFILAAMIGMAAQYLIQMLFGFRAADDDLGAIVNILIYTPCFTLIDMGIYNIEATHSYRMKFAAVCSVLYAAIIAAFCLGLYFNGGSLNIGGWLYVMLALFSINVVYCIYVITREMIKRKKMLETMTATDMLPYVRYSRASLIILFFAALVMPVAILSTRLLMVIGPLALLAVLFFNLTFVALGNNYVPTEELLDKDKEEDEKKGDEAKDDAQEDISLMSPERQAFIQKSLDEWCQDLGYKDTTVNMMTLSRTLRIGKDELTQFFDQSLHSTFRIWLSEIRFNAAKKMMLEYPDYSNDIISAECGFSSRAHLYRLFKAREDCTPTAWREQQTVQ